MLKSIRSRRELEKIGVVRVAQDCGEIVAAFRRSSGQFTPRAKVPWSQPFAGGQLGGGATLERGEGALRINRLHVPRIAPGICEDSKISWLAFPFRTGRNRQTLISVSWARFESLPGSQSHRYGARAEHGARAFAEEKGVHVLEAQAGICQDFRRAGKQSAACLGFRGTPNRRLSAAKQPDRHALRDCIEKQDTTVMGKELGKTGHNDGQLEPSAAKGQGRLRRPENE